MDRDGRNRCQRSRHPTIGLILSVVLAGGSVATPELYDDRCLSCHVDDTPTCAGCHNHFPKLVATTDRDRYLPGDSVVVTVSGSAKPGWIRALLYDDFGTEIDRSTGPTGSGDDGTGPAVEDSVIVPVLLASPAPDQPGTYVWRAAYFGVLDFQQTLHDERWTPVPVTVVASDSTTPVQTVTWAGVKDRYRRPVH